MLIIKSVNPAGGKDTITFKGMTKPYAEDNLTDDQIMKEIVADAAQAFINDPECFQQAVNKDKSFAQKILDFINEFKEWIKLEFKHSNLTNDAAKMLSQTENLFDEVAVKYAGMVESAGKIDLSSNNETIFSVETTKDGLKYVKLDTEHQNLFKGAALSDYGAIAKKFIADNFQGQKISEISRISDNELVDITIEKNGKNEYVFKAFKERHQKNGDLQLEKMKAATEL